MSAVLQCLMISPQLSELILKRLEDLHLQTGDEDKYKITQAFINIYNNRNLKTIDWGYLRNFKWLISNVNPQFQDYRQWDSHEFLSAVLEGLSQELSSQKDYPKRPPSIQSDNSLKEQSEAYWEYFKESEDNWITDLFGGQLVNLIYCDACRQFLYDFDNVTNISVEIPKSKVEEFRLSYKIINIEEWIKENWKEVAVSLKMIHKFFLKFKINIIFFNLFLTIKMLEKYSIFDKASEFKWNKCGAITSIKKISKFLQTSEVANCSFKKIQKMRRFIHQRLNSSREL